jgi:hypothetical protein
MAHVCSRAPLHWISRSRTFRRRWPVYLVMLLLCVTSAAIAILVVNNLDAMSSVDLEGK